MFINPPQYSSPSSVAFNGSNTSFVDYGLDISPTGMFALQLYAFGGLAFMTGVILFSLGLWVWTVVIKREWANSPPDLELHPERMRKKERAREERLKRQKEEKLQRGREKDSIREEKFTPPPIRLNKKGRKSSFSESSTTTSTLRSPATTPSIKVHKPIQRKSSFSASRSPSKGLRVSWASSAATVDVDGHTSEKSIKAESKASSLPSIKFPFDDDTKSVVSSIMPTPIPRARNSIPRLSTSIGARAPQGGEMIAATTPDVCESWSKPANPFPTCRCWDSVDPLDTRRFPSCDIHRYKD